MPALPQQPGSEQQNSLPQTPSAPPVNMPPAQSPTQAPATGVPKASPQPQQAQTQTPDWQQALPAIAQRHGVDPELLRRLVQAESAGDPNASDYKTGTHKGLGQLSPALVKQYGIDPNDPLQNLGVSASELGRLLKKYNNNYGRAVAAYNAGEGTVDKIQTGIPQNGETPNYVLRVLEGYQPPAQSSIGPDTPRMGPQPLGGQAAGTRYAGMADIGQRIQRMLGAGAPAGSEMARLTGQEGVTDPEQMRLLAPEQLMTGTQQAAHPALQAAGEFAGGMTTPVNSLLMPMFGMLGEAGAVAKGLGLSPKLAALVPRAAALGVSAPMLQAAYQNYAPFMHAVESGDGSAAWYHFTHGVLNMFGGLVGLEEAVSPHPAIASRLSGRTSEPSIREQGQPGITPAPSPAAVQIAPTQAPSVTIEGGPQQVTQAGQTGAQEVTGREAGASSRAPLSAPIEGSLGTTGTVTPKPSGPPAGEMQPYAPPATLQQKIGEARATGLLPEQRGQAPTQAYTGPERRNLNDVAREQMTQGLPGQPTPGQQLEQQMRQSLPKPEVDEAQVWQYVTQKGIKDPEWYRQWKSQFEMGDSKSQGKMLGDIQKEIQNAQGPTGVAQAPTATAAQPTGPAQQPIRSPEVSAGPTGQPLQPSVEPIRQVAQKAVGPSVEKKPYVPLPASERPRVSVGGKTGPLEQALAPKGPAPAAPPRATPRPEGLTPTQLEDWKATRRTEASQRQEAMKQEAQVSPTNRELRKAAEPPEGLSRTMDRFLKTKEEERPAREEELRKALEAVKKQGPEAIKQEGEKARQKALKAQAHVEWGLNQLEPSRKEFVGEVRGKGGRLDAGSFREVGIPDALADWVARKGLTFDPREAGERKKWVSDIASNTREAINRALGNTMKEVGIPRELTPEEEKFASNLESKRDEILREIQQHPRPTQRQMDELESLITGIQSTRGTRFVAEKGPQASVDENGALRPSMVANREMWNRFFDRPVGEHSTRPSDEKIQARVEQLKREARLSRSVARQLGVEIEEPTDRVIAKPVEAAPETAIERTPPKAIVEPSEAKPSEAEELAALKQKLAEMEAKEAPVEAKPAAESPRPTIVPRPEPRPTIVPSPAEAKAPSEPAKPSATKPADTLGRTEPTSPEASEAVARPTKGGPMVTKVTQARESLENLGERISKLEPEHRENLGRRINYVSGKFEELSEKIRMARQNIEKMKASGETTRTYTNKEGRKVTEHLEDLEMRMMRLGLDRSKLVDEHLPGLTSAVEAFEKPVKSELRAQQEEQLKQTKEHLANLIRKSGDDASGAAGLRKSIKAIERQLGIKAPAASEAVEATIQGSNILRQAKRSEPRGERMTAGEPLQPGPEDPVADLHALLNAAKPEERGSSSMDFINKALVDGTSRNIGPVAEHLTRPILESMRKGDLTIEEATKRLDKALKTFVEGKRQAAKAPENLKGDVLRAAANQARRIARGEKLGQEGFAGDRPRGGKETFGLVGGQMGKGLKAAERIRKEREQEEKGPFYNQSERVVRENWPGGPDAKASPKDIGGMLANAGISKNELKWSDVDSYLLKAQKEGRQVTRDEVLKYLKEKNPKIEVTEKTKNNLEDREWQEKLTKLQASRSRAFESAKSYLRELHGFTDHMASNLLGAYAEWALGERSDQIEDRTTMEFPETMAKDARATEADRKAAGDPKFLKMAEDFYRAAQAEEVHDSLGGPRGGPRWEQYKLPGGTNYREKLLRMPQTEAQKYTSETGIVHSGEPGAPKGEQSYRSGHWDEPNVVAHIRMDDRVDADGKKTLMIHEVQGDWARELREKEASEEGRGSRPGWVEGPPDMPFTQGHWLELAMKHVLKEAAEKGYDKVAWTTGEQNANFYPGLRKEMDRIGLEEDRNGDVHLVGRTKADNRGEYTPAYNPYNTLERNVDLNNLHKYVGKENAQRLLEAYRKADQQKPSRAYIDAKDFKAGGEHHLELYDKMIPQFMERYGRKWGAKVDKADVQTAEKYTDFSDDQVKAFMKEKDLKSLQDWADYSATHMKEIDAYREKLGLGTKFDSAAVHSMSIPEAMRPVLKGPLRQMGGSQAGFMGNFGKSDAAKARKARAQKEASQLQEAIDKNKPHEIAQKLDDFVKSLPKGTVDERIKMAHEAIQGTPGTQPGRVSQALTSMHADLKTIASWYWNGEKSGIKLKDALSGNTDPKVGLKKALGRLNEVRNISASDAHALVRNIRESHKPDIIKAMHLGSDTGFDKDLLERAANNTRLPEDLRRAAYLAQRLTPAERGATRAYEQFFNEYGEEMVRTGAIRHMLENYMPHMVDMDSAPGQKFMNELRAGVFDTNFKYAKQRIHETMIEGAEKGIKYNLGIDRAIWDYHRRATQSLSSRAFIKELNGVSQQDNRPALVPGYNSIQPIVPAEYNKYPQIKEMLESSSKLRQGVADSYMFRDNRGPSGPIADVSVLEALGIPYNEKTITENDQARMKVSDYKHVDHPDFKQTVYAGKGPDGKPVFFKADLYAHPSIYGDLKNIYEGSQFRTHALGRAALAVTAGSKRMLLKILPSGFHYQQEGLHSIGHGVNPFKKDIWSGKLARESTNDPVVKRGLRSGLQLFDYDYSDAMEGIKGVKGFEKDFENHLFGKFIPGLKIETFKKQLGKNLGTYSKKGYSEDRIYEMTAQQINNAYGMQNRLFTGRTKFMQDLFRLAALAPDFLESRARFVGSAFRPGGRQQAMALVRLGLYMYGTARALNAMTNDGDAHWNPKDAFTWHFRGHEYSMRSVLTDSLFAATDLSSFLISRGALIPRAIFAEGQKAGTPKFMKDKGSGRVLEGIIRSITPIVAQRPALALLKKYYEKKNGPSVAWETFAGMLESIAGIREKAEEKPSSPKGLPHLPRMPRMR